LISYSLCHIASHKLNFTNYSVEENKMGKVAIFYSISPGIWYQHVVGIN